MGTCLKQEPRIWAKTTKMQKQELKWVDRNGLFLSFVFFYFFLSFLPSNWLLVFVLGAVKLPCFSVVSCLHLNHHLRNHFWKVQVLSYLALNMFTNNLFAIWILFPLNKHIKEYKIQYLPQVIMSWGNIVFYQILLRKHQIMV